MKVTITPVAEPEREIDVTNRLVAAIAEEIWRMCGGNEALNWLEAERHLARIVGEARAAARVVGEGAGAHARACAGCPRLRAKGGGRTASPIGSRLLTAARAPEHAMAEW